MSTQTNDFCGTPDVNAEIAGNGDTQQAALSMALEAYDTASNLLQTIRNNDTSVTATGFANIELHDSGITATGAAEVSVGGFSAGIQGDLSVTLASSEQPPVVLDEQQTQVETPDVEPDVCPPVEETPPVVETSPVVEGTIEIDVPGVGTISIDGSIEVGPGSQPDISLDDLELEEPSEQPGEQPDIVLEDEDEGGGDDGEEIADLPNEEMIPIDLPNNQIGISVDASVNLQEGTGHVAVNVPVLGNVQIHATPQSISGMLNAAGMVIGSGSLRRR